VWHDSFTCVTWLIHMCDMTHSHVWHDSFTCVTWLIHMCDMTNSHVWLDEFSPCILQHRWEGSRWRQKSRTKGCWDWEGQGGGGGGLAERLFQDVSENGRCGMCVCVYVCVCTRVCECVFLHVCATPHAQMWYVVSIILNFFISKGVGTDVIHVTYEWVMSHENQSCNIWMSHITYAWAMSHIWWSHVTYEWVMFCRIESFPIS